MHGLLLLSEKKMREKKKVEQEGKQSRKREGHNPSLRINKGGDVGVVGLRLETMGLPDNMLIFYGFFRRMLR